MVRYYLFEHVLPSTMRFPQQKLCASGQELGGDLLFGRRLGFSGTPSDLLPEELSPCVYAAGDDARMLHVLTSPGVVAKWRLSDGWHVRYLLEAVAAWHVPLHALIDTGALVTGYSNVEVARLLLEAGLAHVEGCVFLDAADRKCILLRERWQVIRLEQCGLRPSERFTYYDQVHTTGSDIDQPVAARAALTLGKDMTFRDYAQGAFRMRGIGQGQTLTCFVIPEIAKV